jgi:hypothetical protein
MSTSRKIIAGLVITAAAATAGFGGVSAQSSDAVDLGPRIERACLRIPNLQVRTQNVLTRINGDSDTAGSLMWLDLKIEEATTAGREQRVEVLTNRRNVRAASIDVLEQRQTELDRLAQTCADLGVEL